MVRHIFLSILFFFFIKTVVYCEINGLVTFDNTYDNNPFRSKTATPAYMNTTGLSLNWMNDNENWSILYNGNISLMSNFVNRNYTNQKAGLMHLLSIDSASEHQILFSSYISTRLNQKDIEYYDYYQALTSAGYEYNIDETTSAGAGYNLRYRTYPNFNNLNYLEHFSYIEFKTSFETKTSIALEIDLGLKDYLNENTSVDSGTSTTHKPPTSASSVEGNENSNTIFKRKLRGYGRNVSKFIQSRTESTPIEPHIVYTYPSTSQVVLNMRITQSLAQKTGLSATYRQRWNLSQDGLAVINGTVNYAVNEEELFDDPYNYQSNEINLALTHYLPFDIKGQISGFYWFKRYGYPADMEKVSGDNRNDEYRGIALNFEKRFDDEWFVFSGFKLGFEYYLFDNYSNSNYFNYGNQGCSVYLSTSF